MRKYTTAVLVLSLGAGIVGIGAVLAAATSDEAINTRQSEMKANMKAMKMLVSVLKGEKPYDAATVQAAVGIIKEARAEGVAQDVWSATAQSGISVKSEAKAEIWSDAAGFSEAWKALDSAVSDLEASRDEAAFKAAFPALGASCKGCHEKYRAAE